MLPGTIVWLGGAAFVASLSFCGWTYLVGWSSPANVEMSWRAIVLDAILVTLFAAHHSLFARDRVKAWVARAVPEALVRSLYVWVASGLLVAMLWLWQPVGGELYRLHGWFGWAAVALQLTGLWLIVQAVRAIDALELAGIRQVTLPAPPASPALPALPALVTTGPYRLVRHPLYLGWILVTFGAPHLTGDRLTFAVLTTAYVLVAVPWEERSLARTFGTAYARYSAEVRWRVVPYLY